MNSTVLFRIKNENLGYKKHPEVIHVENLSIEAGKLVVIIGISGAGKSTLLETLGLMRASVPNKKTDGKNIFYNSSLFLDNKQQSLITLNELWKTKSRAKINYIRKKHFSFIFQNTNLMPNFSIKENILSMASIQNKYSFKNLKTRFEEIVSEIDLTENILENIPSNISGGQKQRAAFARATLPFYTVLFGDEPTGNLDERFAVQLMKIIQDSINNNTQESENKKTAILVSHNISLSLQFADKIIVLSKFKHHGPSVINDKTIFNKNVSNNTWSYCGNTLNDKDVAEKVRELMYQNTELVK